VLGAPASAAQPACIGRSAAIAGTAGLAPASSGFGSRRGCQEKRAGARECTCLSPTLRCRRTAAAGPSTEARTEGARGAWRPGRSARRGARCSCHSTAAAAEARRRAEAAVAFTGPPASHTAAARPRHADQCPGAAAAAAQPSTGAHARGQPSGAASPDGRRARLPADARRSAESRRPAAAAAADHAACAGWAGSANVASASGGTRRPARCGGAAASVGRRRGPGTGAAAAAARDAPAAIASAHDAPGSLAAAHHSAAACGAPSNSPCAGRAVLGVGETDRHMDAWAARRSRLAFFLQGLRTGSFSELGTAFFDAMQRGEPGAPAGAPAVAAGAPTRVSTPPVQQFGNAPLARPLQQLPDGTLASQQPTAAAPAFPGVGAPAGSGRPVAMASWRPQMQQQQQGTAQQGIPQPQRRPPHQLLAAIPTAQQVQLEAILKRLAPSPSASPPPAPGQLSQLDAVLCQLAPLPPPMEPLPQPQLGPPSAAAPPVLPHHAAQPLASGPLPARALQQLDALLSRFAAPPGEVGGGRCGPPPRAAPAPTPVAPGPAVDLASLLSALAPVMGALPAGQPRPVPRPRAAQVCIYLSLSAGGAGARSAKLRCGSLMLSSCAGASLRRCSVSCPKHARGSWGAYQPGGRG
jgi:hypothetical protein